jgi:hypothetical protein
VKSIHQTYPDLFDADASETRHRVVAALDHMYTARSLSPRADHTILAAMRRPSAVPDRQQCGPRIRLSLGALIPASLLIFAVALMAALRAPSPAPVSAEAIIQRAAAAGLSPNSALHVVYRESYSGKYAIWAEYGADGKLTHFAGTEVESTQGITTRINRCVGGRVVMRCYDYEPASMLLHRVVTVTAAAEAKATAPFSRLRQIDGLTGAGVARLLARLMDRSPAGVHLLSERRLNGALVYPIRVDGQPSSRQPTIIYYFDAHSYFLRGMVIFPPRGPGFADMVTESMTLLQRQTMPLAAVPRGTFKLRPPSGKQVWVVIP